MSDEKRMVYVVTEGMYSAYSIQGVFSTREKAEQYKANVEAGRKTESMEVEVFEVDCDLRRRWATIYDATVMLERADAPIYTDASPRPHFVDQTLFPMCSDVQQYPEGLGICVSSLDSIEHATKVAAEKRQEWLRTRDMQPPTPAP